MTLEMVVWGVRMGIVFSGVSCAVSNISYLCPPEPHPTHPPTPYPGGLDEVDEVLFPCFPECKWKKSDPMNVN